MQPLLSICICALQSRIGMLGKLSRLLEEQIEYSESRELVEVLINLDNKEKSTGKKRQELLEQAQGKYVIYIDDDDEIYGWYIEELLRFAKSDADCAAMNGIMTTNGKNPIEWRISKDYENVTIRENGKNIFLRHCNHISPIRRSIALQVGFPDKSNAEDKYYSDGLKGLLKTEQLIKPPLYHYKYVSTNKEYK